MRLVPNQEPVQTLAADRTDEPFANGIGTRGLKRGGDDIDPSTRRDIGKVDAVLIIIIADQMLGALTEGRHVAQLLGHPLVGGLSGDLWGILSVSAGR